MKSPVDIYTLKARIFPAFLLFSPIILAMTAWVPEAKLPTVALFGVTGNVVFGFFAAERVRDAGKNIESKLWRLWGGPPTTQLLRHRNMDVSSDLRDCWRRSLEKLTGVPLPSASSESSAPEKADQAYEAAIFRLREKTREVDKYPLVFKENISYGFRRNLWALKPSGIFLSMLSVLICAAKIVVVNLKDWTLESHSSIALVICVMLFVWWMLVITKSWVRVVAFEYAKRLLGASILLADSQPDPTPKLIALP